MRFLGLALLLTLAACATTYAGGEPVYDDTVY
jgi:hypothetical protein